MEKVTIYDVAEEAGLSIATVSRYINHKGGISEKSEAKIVAAIEKLHYTPVASAQNLASGNSGTIGIQIGDKLVDHYFYQFLSGVYHAAMEEGFDVLLTRFDGDPDQVCSNVLTRKKMEGIIFPSVTGRESEYIKGLYDREFPICYAGIRQQWDTRKQNVYGGFTVYRREAMELLIQRGCKRILWIEQFQRDLPKAEGIIQGCSKPEAFLDPVVIEGMSVKEIHQMLVEILKKANHPDGIFFISAEIAGYVYAAAGESGLKIPDDVRLITSIHSMQQDKLFTPNLAAVYIDAYQMGYQAGIQTCAMIKGSERNLDARMVPYKILENETI